MARTPEDVTDFELGLLQVLWDGGPSTVRRLAEALYDRVSAARVSSVQTVLYRLERRGFVAPVEGAVPRTYRAAVGRDELIGRRLEAVAEKLCEGSLTPLLSHLVRADRLSAEDRQALRDLIDRLDEEGGGR